MPKVLITTVPFGQKDTEPLNLLCRNNIEYFINPLGRKIRNHELAKMAVDFDAIIAGTEKIDKVVFDHAPSVRMISRVGIGLDSIDLLACRAAGVSVSYTPDAPAPAVAEFTVGLMLSCLRHISQANHDARARVWHRHFGRRLPEVTIGIIGAGRIGSRVIQHLRCGFGATNILVNDTRLDLPLEKQFQIQRVEKEKIYREADIISLHVPLTSLTQNMIREREMLSMKKDAVLINTSRGGIVNEADLAEVLSLGHLSSVALDVFEEEPYGGPLCMQERCFLTSHMGSMSIDCRSKMEIEATQEAIRFLQGHPLKSPVPEQEYTMRTLIQ